MVMVGQERRLQQPLTWGRRERWAVIAVAVALALGAVAVVVYALTSSGGGSSSAGCVQVTTPSFTGAVTVRACGQDGRNLCLQGASSGVPVAGLRAECRRLGLPFGTSAKPA